VASKIRERTMSEESLVSPVRESGPQPVEHRPRKAYVSPGLKVYGKMSELTASGTGFTAEDEVLVDGGACLTNPTKSSCLP
jgi:hypothetical protein